MGARPGERSGWELCGVTVGGADAERDERAGLQAYTGNLHRGGDGSVAELVRTLKPQEFLDRTSDQPRLGVQARQLSGVLEQRLHGVGDEVGRRLVAAGRKMHWSAARPRGRRSAVIGGVSGQDLRGPGFGGGGAGDQPAQVS